MTHDAIIEVVRAHKERKQLQRMVDYGWKDCVVTLETLLRHSVEGCFFRLKPTPVRVPLTVADLPPVCWIKEEENESMFLVTRRWSSGLVAGGRSFDIAALRNDEWSSDLVTWHPFWKEGV